MLTVYGDPISGNCYKIALMLAHLQQPHRWITLDILQQQTRTQDFLHKNPNGRVPVLELDNGTCLAESNAILHYLARGTAYLPEERLAQAKVLQWMFFEQYSHEPYIAVARFIVRYLGRPAHLEQRLADTRAPGKAALQIMEQQLQRQSFIATNDYSIADIALFAYTQVADEGGFALADYPAINAWMQRIREQPGYLPMYSTASDNDA